MLYEKGKVKYDMTTDNGEKTFHLYAEGFFTEEDGQSFIYDYNRLVKTFSTKDYKLIIDVSGLKPSTPKVGELLQSLLARYIEVPFKKRYLITGGNPITVSQCKRLGSSIPGWEQSIEYIATIDNAI